MFRHVTQELLNIEKKCKRKLRDIKNKKFRKIAKISSYCWKALDELDFLEMIL